MKHRFLFFPSGMCSVKDGKYIEFGNGHVVRCVNLARQLIRLNPESEMTFGVSGPEAEIAKRLVGDEFSLVQIPLVTGDSPYWHYDFKLRFETNLVRFLEPSMVISDAHAEGLIAAKYNSCKCAAILDLPPIELFHIYAMLADIVFVPLLESNYKLPPSLKEKSNFVGPVIDSRSINSVEKLTAEEIRREIGIEERFVLVYLSRIHSDRKKFLDLIQQSFKALLREKPGMKLVMVGPGAAREDLDSSLDVCALDFVENIHKYIKASSAFVTRSPIIAMEALALRIKPAIIPISSDRNQSTMAQSLGEYLDYMALEDLVPERLTNFLESTISEGTREEKHVREISSFPHVNGTESAAQRIMEMVNSK